MSRSSPGNALERCREAALDVAWSQWIVLGGQAGGRVTEPGAIVDPEALLLFSCAMRDDEPRLWDLVGGFLADSSSLLSVQRMRNLCATFPEAVRDVLPEVAAIAVSDGKDARWRPLAGQGVRPYRAGKVHRAAGRIADPGALLLRLRLAFGVNSRTDALAFLLGIAPASASAKEAAESTGYGAMPVRRALEAMATSRIVVAEGARPERYHVRPDAWAPLLGGAGRLPAWRHWHLLYAFLAEVLPSPHGAQVREPSPYLESGELRRAVLQHRAAFTRNRIAVPEPSDYPGEAFLEGFDRTLSAVGTWLGENV